MKRIHYLLLIATFTASCNHTYNTDADSAIIDTTTSHIDAGELHNECLDKIFSAICDCPAILDSRGTTPTGLQFATEMANIQLAVLDGTDLSNMSDEELTTFIQTSVNTSISPEVLAVADTAFNKINLSIVSSFDSQTTLSSTMENYIEEMDQILTSSSIQDYNRGIELAKIHLKWNGAGNDYENMLISSTYDIFIDSRTYWSENADAWAESMNIDSSDIEKNFMENCPC